MSEEKRVALLIDAENIPAHHADLIMKEVEKFGNCLYKRVYGNCSRLSGNPWSEAICRHSLKPVPGVRNTRGKNTADISLVIDAMDILLTRRNTDIFCIVSSDSDFIPLIQYIKEHGAAVIGMGEPGNTVPPLQYAYDEFVHLNPPTAKKGGKPPASPQQAKAVRQMPTPGKKAIEAKIRETIAENDKSKADLSLIKKTLDSIFRNFEIGQYRKKGNEEYMDFEDFVSDFKSLRLVKEKSRVFVCLKDTT